MKIARLMGIVLGAWTALAAQAGVLEPLQFSGFATLGGVVLDDRSLSLARAQGLNKPGGGYLDPGPDSVLGLQMNAPLGPRSDFTLQVRADEDDKGHFTPRVGWAFLRHEWSPTLSTRIGRLRAPFFVLSDSLQVNYANPWVRPPPEVYGLNPFNDLDGADLLYRWVLEGLEMEVRPYFGGGRIEFSNEGSARLRNAKGVNLAVYRGHLSIHAGHGEGRFETHWGDAQFKQLDGALRTFGFADVADELSGERGYARFDSVGFQWDDGDWLVSGEFVRRRANRYIPSNHAWFLSLAYRMGNFTPYVVTARQVEDQPPVRAQLPVPALQQGLAGFEASRNGAQHSVSLGVRWDVAPGWALKSEYTRAGVERGAWGAFFPREISDPLGVGGQTVHMLSLSVDRVF